jgi:GT2 family glycosyltransferase
MMNKSISPALAFVTGPVSIAVQSVLYNLDAEHIKRALMFLNRAAAYSRAAGKLSALHVRLGDCSHNATHTASMIQEYRELFSNITSVSYTVFDGNLGSAAGHNRLFGEADADLTMILNPDVLMAPRTLTAMIDTLRTPGVGVVEARQLPIEHGKDFHSATGQTCWASTACALASSALYMEIGGFDSDTFFLYCDDVDFSWQVRLKGYSVVYQPSAVIFHDKRIGQNGEWLVGAAESYYSAEAGLLLPYKYSRSDLTQQILDFFTQSDNEIFLKAAAAFRERKKTGRLPKQFDADHRVAQFIQGHYAQHRFFAR